jgi:hypothetical protein
LHLRQKRKAGQHRQNRHQYSTFHRLISFRCSPLF